jgi:hypothetical protein
MLQELAMWH